MGECYVVVDESAPESGGPGFYFCSDLDSAVRTKEHVEREYADSWWFRVGPRGKSRAPRVSVKRISLDKFSPFRRHTSSLSSDRRQSRFPSSWKLVPHLRDSAQRLYDERLEYAETPDEFYKSFVDLSPTEDPEDPEEPEALERPEPSESPARTIWILVNRFTADQEDPQDPSDQKDAEDREVLRAAGAVLRLYGSKRAAEEGAEALARNIGRLAQMSGPVGEQLFRRGLLYIKEVRVDDHSDIPLCSLVEDEQCLLPQRPPDRL